jgi:hypothetical protein
MADSESRARWPEMPVFAIFTTLPDTPRTALPLGAEA